MPQWTSSRGILSSSHWSLRITAVTASASSRWLARRNDLTACTRVPGGKRRATLPAVARELLGPRATHLAHAVRSDDAIGEGDDGGDQREDDEDGVSGAELGADAEGFVEDDVDASENAESNAKKTSEDACVPFTSSHEWPCARLHA